ncbi:YfcC family protein [Geothrix sp. PMB-07]|uniref:YfcC family protein n=1 Tax=Geothrix sp. PMB-07 TaxID=3068640 RepID=UPI00274060C5|nr:Na+/H+ antiporter NhaC family protein [Geothrix sp. PMB-07]WLT30838.1 Na+/H+ antiporter NhaC family protein [Geothrix sp. PMB-07]
MNARERAYQAARQGKVPTPPPPPPPTSSSLKMPHTLVIVAALILLVLILSWLVPSGEFQRMEKLLPDGSRLKVPVDGTYHQLTKTYLGLQTLFLSPIKGFLDGAGLISFLLIIGGSFGIFQETGAVEQGIKRLTVHVRRHPWLETLFIPVLMAVFSLAGAVFGMAEELIPLVMIFIALSRALGYDSIVGTAIPFLGAAAGFACAFFNPFTVGVAQGIAGVPIYSGLAYRVCAWVVATGVVIAYVMIYAAKIKKNPELSPVRDIDLARESQASGAGDSWNAKHILALLTFLGALILLVYGVLKHHWYLEPIAALFLGMGILIGLISRMAPSTIAKHFVAGAKDMVGVVFIVACARALLVIANDARIMDTLLLCGSSAIKVLPKAMTAQVMFLLQCGINFFIHSGTSQAALTMPVLAPLSDLVGITRQTCVYSFALSELINPILPTSAVTMGVLGAAKIPWERWAKWFLPLMLILVVLAFLLLVPPTLFFHWGPV